MLSAGAAECDDLNRKRTTQQGSTHRRKVTPDRTHAPGRNELRPYGCRVSATPAARRLRSATA